MFETPRVTKKGNGHKAEKRRHLQALFSPALFSITITAPDAAVRCGLNLLLTPEILTAVFSQLTV